MKPHQRVGSFSGFPRSVRASLANTTLAVVTLALLLGCETTPDAPAPAPPPRNVVAPLELTDEFVDAAARDLARRLANVPSVRTAATKVVLAFAPIQNRTTLSGATLAAAQDRLRNQLTGMDVIQGNFILVGDTYANDEELLRGFQPNPADVYDPLGPGTAGQPADYDPNLLHLLRVSAVEAGSGAQRTVTMSVRLTHPASRRDLLATSLDARLVWDGNRRRWVVLQRQ